MNVKTHSFILFLLMALLLMGKQAPAQQRTLYFEKINDQNGLSHNRVNCITQDLRGFLWIGTNDGLNRYDGHNFKVFRNEPGNAASISGNIISDLVVDAGGVLWIATIDGGLTRYDYRLPAKEQFKQYKHLPEDSSSIPVNIVNDIYDDKAGYLWLATSGSSIVRLNKKTGQFSKLLITRTTAMVLCPDASGMIWVGRQGGGLLKINPQTFEQKTDSRYDNLYAKLPHTVITSLYRDAENNMWFGSWDKFLYEYDHHSGVEKTYSQSPSPVSFINDEIKCFAEDTEGRLWMGGRTQGLQVLDKKTGAFTQYKNAPELNGSISDNEINCIYVDKNGSTWLGTGKGINVLHRQHDQFMQTFLPGYRGQNITVYDFFTEPGGGLLIGTSNGIYYRKPGQEALTHHPLSYNGTPLSVTKFYKDSRGTMYIGTNYSLFTYDHGSGRIQILPNTEKDMVMNKIIESRVVGITEDVIDNNPVLMVLPYGHYLAYYDLVTKKWVSRLDSAKKIISRFNLKDNLVRKIYHAPDGHIWLANAKEGLGEWKRQSSPQIEYYKNDPNKPGVLSSNNVFDITSDGKNNLWISTYGGGLNYFTPANKSFSHMSACGNLVEGIQTDAKENVWMIAAGNLHRYNPLDKTCSSFQLPDMEKTGGVSGYLYKAPNGEMFAAGKNYFIAFDPAKIVESKVQPQVHFTGFEIFNQSFSNLLYQDKVTLKYKQNYFTIEFAAPGFSGGTPVHYAYKLEGFSNNWIEIGTRNFVSFSNLGGGDYTLRIRATNTPGVWSPNEATLKIRVIPPVWKRWWFYLLCALVIAASIYALYRYRVNEILKRQAMRNKIASDLHDNIGSTLSSISVYSQVAEIQSRKQNTVALDDVLQKIGNASTEMISEMNDIVWAIKPGNDTMEKMTARMESYAKPLLAAKNISFTFNFSNDLDKASLEMSKRKNVYLIFKEAINNALKYSGCTHLDVTITHSRSQLQMIITDNGKGFNMAEIVKRNPGNMGGNGLKNMEMRALEMKGQLNISSAPGQGTTIKLDCPIP